MADIFDLTGKRIFVAGHNGMVGSALLRQLAHESCEIITADRKDVNLVRQNGEYPKVWGNCRVD